MNDIKEMYDRMSEAQDELNDLIRKSGSIYIGARFDINVEVDKNIISWIFLDKIPYGSDLIGNAIKDNETLKWSVEEARTKILSTTREEEIAKLQKRIDELKSHK